MDLDLDPDPRSEKLLDRDPHKMNVDPQPWFTSSFIVQFYNCVFTVTDILQFS